MNDANDMTDTNDPIEAYLAERPPAIRAALEHLRGQIQRAVPAAEPGMSYGMPAFRYRGKAVAGFASHTTHCGFYPMSGSVLDACATELTGYVVAKGTVRFDPTTGLPDDLVTAIVHARMAEIERMKR